MRLGVLLVSFLALNGCSWLFHDRSNDYLNSKIQPNIQVPNDVAEVSLRPQLPIPEVKNELSVDGEFVLPRPTPLVLADNEEPTSASLSELSQVSLETNLLKDGNGTPILRLNIEFARAWSELGEALKKADINITDLNRSIGTYYIELIKPGNPEDVGFWSGLFGGEPEPIKVPLQVKLNQARTGVYIAIHEDAENLAEDAQAQSLLEQIQDNL
ncbi:MAG: outer membrane protein assembly factor BamC [Bermanella sp.]|tara:strand:- start:840 stop:1481 length:642 start_codon:yes stop_codon:yes gene_type:complete